MIIMLVYYYLFVFQYFNKKINSLFSNVFIRKYTTFSFLTTLQKQFVFSLCNLFGVHG